MAFHPPGFYKKSIFFLSLAIAATILLPAACVKEKAPVPWPGETWATATPESQGLDSALLAEAVQTLRGKNINIHSILLIRHGYEVMDAAFYPYDGQALHDVASVTKSVTATLVGQAVGEGILPRLNTPIVDLLDSEGLKGWGRGWEKVTLENLVTMSSGAECGDPPAEETIFFVREEPVWVEAIKQLPVVEKPGERFDYCSPNFHLLSAAVARAAGMPLADFARLRLFDPIGIEQFNWPEDPQGVSVGWGDLRMRPADMARLGYLYLNDGMWEDQRILPRGWVASAVKPRHPVPGGAADYGYGWWLARGDFKGVYEAKGRGGQNITVWPKTGIILVTTGGGYDWDTVVEALLPAVRSEGPLPENLRGLKALEKALADAKRPPVPQAVGDLPSRAFSVSHRWYTMDRNALNLDRFLLAFDVESDEAVLTARVEGEDFSCPVGLDGVYRLCGISPSGDPAALRGRWETADRFVLDYNEITRINRFRMEMTFSRDEVSFAYSEPTGQIAGKITGRRE